MMRCFYHSDLDGEASAAIVKLWSGDDCILSPINYNQSFPIDEISSGQEIIIVDFNLQEEGMWTRLLEVTPNVVWIDHHSDAIECSEENGMCVLPGLRRIHEGAGCELTWRYLWGDEPIPRGILLIGDFDEWVFRYGDETRRFQQGLAVAYDTRPVEGWRETWVPIFDSDHQMLEDACRIGEKSLRKRRISDAQDVASYGFEAVFEGYRTAVINRNRTGSDYFASLEGRSFDIYMPVVFDGERWSVSIYEGPGIRGKGVHLGELAHDLFDGGGHAGAAGFQCNHLPIRIVGRL